VRGLREKEPSLALHSIDLLGHGQGAPLPPGANLETMALDVLDQIARLKLEEPVRVVGHSLGGRVALMARRLAPGSVAPIVLLDITASPIRRRARSLMGVADAMLSAPDSTPNREAMRAHLAATLSGPIVEWLLMNLKREGGVFRWAIDREALVQFDRTASDEDLWDTVDETILCIRGGESPYVSDDDVRAFEERGARAVTLPGAGHFVHVDVTEAVIDLLLDFFGCGPSSS
jgi:pimeloyl-ACP methyl ester carboxylesterase